MTRAQGVELYRVQLLLDCAISDEAVWSEVETRFKSGHRVYTSADFHFEVMDVLREELKRAETALAQLQKAHALLKETHAADDAELARYRASLSGLSQALRG